MSFRIAATGANVYWSCRPGQSLAEGADASQLGRTLFPGCRGGGCGACKVRIVSGEFSERRCSATALSQRDRAARLALACCVEPLSDLTIVFA